jgi:hypothetical protein
MFAGSGLCSLVKSGSVSLLELDIPEKYPNTNTNPNMEGKYL